MQQKIVIAALFAGSAVAAPWGPGGRWGPPSDFTESAGTGLPTGAPTGFGGFPSGIAVHTDIQTAVQVQTVIQTVSAIQTIATSAVPSAIETDDQTAAASAAPLAMQSDIQTAAASAVPSAVQSEVQTAAASSTLADNHVAKPATTSTKAKATQAKTSAAPSSTSTSGATTYSGTSYQDQVVNHHNVHRANHSSPALTWDAGLAATAQKIAASCVFAHDTSMDGGGYGQNIEAGTGAADVWQAVTGSWYNGEVNSFAGNYGQANPSANFDSWGHFSQIVWKSTTSVGCATVHCPNGVSQGDGTQDFTVCNYKPPGNFATEYVQNINKSLGKPTVDTEQIPAHS